ncbi:MAG: 50S ribosomal protein L44e [Candidatus Micrarchaeota archaeon]|nr:50S ribosomal protein L44e [Candidatus Micrarchaeota archaeon]
MKIAKQITAYCPKCRKHTMHKVKVYSKGPTRGTDMGSRRRDRKLKGYTGKVKGQATVLKIAKRNKLMLECADCGYIVERVVGTRAKKKIEIKA